MKKSILIPLLWLFYTGIGQSVKQPSEKFKHEFERTVSDLYRKHNLHADFIIGIVNGNGLVYSFSIKGDSSTLHSKISSSTPIYIASHTKAMTGTLLKILESEKRIDLSAPISRYLPGLHFNGKINPDSITTRDLLSHTHGISNNVLTYLTAYLGHTGNDDDLIHILNNYSKFDPSRKFEYSNIGPIMAGLIIGKVAGDWKTLMQEKLFRPLQMINTSADISKYKVTDIAPTQIFFQNGKFISASFQKQNSTMHAAGGIMSTLDDLSKWMAFNINKRNNTGPQLLTPEQITDVQALQARQDRRYFTYQRYGYSLGWDLATYNNENILTRNGGFSAVTFNFSFIPDKKIGVIAYANTNEAGSFIYVAANLAYNLLLSKDNTAALLKEETALFEKGLQNITNTVFIERSISADSSSEKLTGYYSAKDGWPPIEIVSKGGEILVKWKELTGRMKLEQESGATKTYSVDFGAMSRTFRFHFKSGEADQFENGSIIYSKNRQ
ncbi:serine hydrolase domain-containing protein [Sediminibacterium ginsengisoli]|uniref:CubicO group peptidase, beta-lactamase class C family n=1 Tax=Sediminibacterium ginsengisoli TaxID=413434 RepID=A0A1T4LAN5_9BACT|nr:serine hydrolase domain-containing protein [Sediminibacterium ginsengisoli]SJZ51661.1 CubicO group peptidase, beta-lactamase class C family [Sediminibacterium ginsengisoli]